MQDIRQEIQDWLELVTRGAKNIPFDKEVIWEDIEDVYNGGDYETPLYKAMHDQLTFERVFCDAISIDHMCSEICEEDFEIAMKILARYKGILLTDSFSFNTKLSRGQ